MLILRRRIGETLLIGDNVKVTIMDIYEGGVRIAIDAPREVTVLRSELVQAADANRDAAGPSPQELIAMLNRERRRRKNKSRQAAKAAVRAAAAAALVPTDTTDTQSVSEQEAAARLAADKAEKAALAERDAAMRVEKAERAATEALRAANEQAERALHAAAEARAAQAAENNTQDSPASGS